MTPRFHIFTGLWDNPRLQTEWFPKYTPELNPAEQVWNEFKGHTTNSLPLDKQDIRNSLHANKRRVRRSQDKLRSLILASKLASPFGYILYITFYETQ